eukprot:365663-Chlamydomonas_euryale.AAC.8
MGFSADGAAGAAATDAAVALTPRGPAHAPTPAGPRPAPRGCGSRRAARRASCAAAPHRHGRRRRRCGGRSAAQGRRPLETSSCLGPHTGQRRDHRSAADPINPPARGRRVGGTGATGPRATK